MTQNPFLGVKNANSSARGTSRRIATRRMRTWRSTKLEEMKELQNLRKRPHGVNALGLALGTKITVEDECIAKDPFKVKSGGMVNMQALKSGKVKQVDDAYDTGIGTQFSVETNKRDEDEEMMRFIEEELSKKKRKVEPPEQAQAENKSAYTSPEEAALRAVPDHLRESSTKRSEEMLSNQMLNGIPEVDLGIEAKIKNIEATEEAKLRLLWEKQNKKDGPSPFVPTNMAVNFVQHNRFNIDGEGLKKKTKDEKVEEKPKKKDERATDDYHYEKFKKQFRRY
ncbi:telomere length and silencing protein 1 homolog isoform X2 [Tribolium madens]|uniref:telomere length and silencing protein 1 homolog isoform X2 n=1 Tax=Tribolium madens TaxID=41895 RepID=UPI001CF75C01|nr:telomere length and silencing protein 1 homolog isoform X2 [Tribolium madens]XP_044270480.1 telomere length and silencing protein 1 homolog isoform X2 [Tribolium madens]